MAGEEYNQRYATREEFLKTESWLQTQQDELKGFTTVLGKLVSTMDHVTNDVDAIRKDMQRMFDRRSDDLAAARPNYFALVIGGVTILGSSMAFVFTFVSLVLSPMQVEDKEQKTELAKLQFQTQQYQAQANKRIQEGNTYMGKSEAEMLEVRKDVDWNRNEIISMIRDRHTSLDEQENQELNRRERERIENKK